MVKSRLFWFHIKKGSVIWFVFIKPFTDVRKAKLNKIALYRTAYHLSVGFCVSVELHLQSLFPDATSWDLQGAIYVSTSEQAAINRLLAQGYAMKET